MSLPNQMTGDRMSPEELKRWVDYQNQVSAAVQEMTHEQLDQFIESLQETLFEAKAKYQRAYAEKNTRAIEARKKSREELINDPRYSPDDAPGNPAKPFAPKTERKSRSEKLGDMLSMFGMNPAGLIKESQKFMDDKRKAEQAAITAQKKAEEQKKFEATPKVTGIDCVFSPTGKHEYAHDICRWCNERM